MICGLSWRSLLSSHLCPDPLPVISAETSLQQGTLPATGRAFTGLYTRYNTAAELNSEMTPGFTKNLLRQMGLHTHQAEHERLCCREGLTETASLLTLYSFHSP